MEKDNLAMAIATFRFGVIADFVTGVRLKRGEKQRLLKAKSERAWKIPGSERTRVSRATILLWIEVYKKAGCRLEGLMPRRRRDLGQYRKLDSTVRMAIRSLKAENPRYTLPVIVTKLRHAHVLKAHEDLNRSLVYRFIKNERLDEMATPAVDRRRFEAEFPNEVWQCDVLHGPLVKCETGPQRKAYLVAILDDHSRLVVHAQFYLSETLESLKDCLRQAIGKRGLPQKFYVDNGACYRATNLQEVLALLGIALTHSRPYTPQGRGKIERWFGYVRQDFIPLYADRPMSLQELNERLESWVDKYNASKHSMTQTTPYDRFRKNLACVRPAPADLVAYFRRVEHRVVRKDRTVQLGGKVLEVPVGLIDKKIELRFHEEAPEEVEVFFEGRSYGQARPLNAFINARVGRDWGQEKSQATKETSRMETTPAVPASGRLFGGGKP